MKWLKNLNKNMLKMMQIIAENNYITANELGMYFGNRMSPYRYINYLKRTFVIEEIDTMMYPRKAYCLNDDGYKFLESLNLLRISQKFNKTDYVATQFYHKTIAAQVRIIFEQHPYVVDYRPAKVIAYFLQKDGKNPPSKQCDAEIFIKGKEKEYIAGLEVELNQKKKETYAKNILDLDTVRQDLHCAWWLCNSEVIISAVSEMVNKLRPQLKFPDKQFFCLLDEFKAKKFDAVWKSANGEMFHILPRPEESKDEAPFEK